MAEFLGGGGLERNFVNKLYLIQWLLDVSNNLVFLNACLVFQNFGFKSGKIALKKTVGLSLPN